MTSFWTKKQIAYLKNNFGLLKCVDIAIKLGKSYNATKTKATRLKLRSENKYKWIRDSKIKYHHNDNFFYEDSLISAYWAGFIAADGCIINSPHSRLCLGLAIKDRNHLKQFTKDIQFSGKMYAVNKKGHKSVTIAINHAHTLNKALKEKFKITEKKSLTLKFPKITDDKLAYAFIIGYIDGDGSIFYSKTTYKRKNNIIVTKKYVTLSILGTKQFLLGIVKVLSKLDNTFTVNITKDKNIYKISSSGKKILNILKQLKSIDVPKLERKWKLIK